MTENPQVDDAQSRQARFNQCFLNMSFQVYPFLKTEISKSPRKKKTGSFRGRSLLQSVPSPKTVHWTVFGFTPCRAPKVNIDLRSIWDSVPNPARGAASGLCQRDIVPLETRCCRLRRLGTPSQTLPEAPPLDSAKGTLPLWKPGVYRPAVDMGLRPMSCQKTFFY